ncbi:MAG TPA: hypothetical protein VHB27_09765, partial [Rhodopila sp.]|uniref:hypothetical protein n=1 Tax=Rhodopila sp. TaxID=2480087 RepID=UPI002C4562B2
APAAAMLVRFHLNGNGAREGAAQVLASPGVPAIGPGSAWRARFNLRGDTTLLFRVTAPVTVGVHADGPPLTARVTTPEGAVMNAQGGGAVASSWALSPGWYVLVLTPKPGAVGLLDLTLGPRGVTPPQPEPAGPDAPDLSLGEQTIDAQSQLAVLANRVPDTASVLSARALPVEIADSPLVETLQAGQSATREVHTRLAGTLTLRDVASPEPLETRPVAAGATVQVALPAADHPRTLAVALLPAAATATPAPAPAVSLPVLQAGTPAFLDLKRDEQASFALTVAQGGLYQVQTTGRLKTAGRIGTAFIPDLGEANANGVGNNMLLQRYLRAGLYHLDVTAHDSAGRLGIVAASTPLPEGATLLPGGSVRATLMPGSGVAFPIHIETEGRYHLDLLGDGRTLSARLEDADGWPLRAAGDLTSIDQDLSPGRYRLIVQPASVDVRVVARLRRIETPVALTGHGPHPLPFEATQALQWREPAARGDPRDPDVWTFSLAGPAKVTLTLTGDGMTAALQADPPSAAPLARFVAGQPLAIDLPAGQYRVLASALGRNDRLDYTIRLHSDQLQPGVPRLVTLPADLPFAIAAPRVVNLTSFGRTPLRAELRDAAGTVLARTAGRTDDWSIAVSRQLAAGSYHLVLSTLAPPAGGQATQDGDNTQAADQDTGDSSGMAGDSGDDQGSSQDASDQSAGQGGQDADQNADQGGSGQGADQSTPSDSDQDQSAGPPPARTEITLSLPQDQPDTALPAAGTLRLPGTGVQHVTLPTAPAGGLLVAAAEAPVEIILALEQRDAGGTWRTIGQSQGLAPVIGVPVPEGTIPQGTIPQGTISEGTIAWRASAWTVDGGTVPIQFAARAVSAPPAPVGTVALTKVPLDGITQPWFAASVADPGALMLHASAPDAALLASSAPDQPAEPPPNATIAAQSERVWLLAPHQGAVRLSAVQTAPGAPLGVAVPAGGHAILPAASGPCAYVASSGLGQPGIDAGRGFGVASSDTSSGVSGGAFALCGGKTVTAWNAGGGDPLRLALRTIPLAARPEAPVDQAYAGLVPPHAILKLRLPAGAKRIDVSLAAGTALVTPAADPVTVWSGGAALSRSLTGSWTTAELVNTTDAPTPAAVTVLPVEAPWTLAAGQVFRRFFGAAGSFSLPVAAQAGQRLMVAGDATAIVQQADGRVRQGAAIALDGPGRADVRHGTGAVALWIEGPGVSPWPAATPRDVSLPQRVTLEGQAMALRLSPPAPVLLRLSSSAPVILALGEEAPVLFGQGAAFARYLPAGAATLRLLAPQDGPLSGSLDLSATPVTNVAEGLGAPVAIPPGGAAVFGFTVTAGGPVGLGVRADPDRVAARLLDEHGTVLETGVSMLRTLAPGHYLLEASVPPDAPTVLARPAVLGIAPHPNPPPPDVIRGLLLAAGLTPPDSAR